MWVACGGGLAARLLLDEVERRAVHALLLVERLLLLGLGLLDGLEHLRALLPLLGTLLVAVLRERLLEVVQDGLGLRRVRRHRLLELARHALRRGEVDRVYQDSDSVGYELTGHAALFQGDFKIVRNLPPLGDGVWRLYNIVQDPGEVDDLKEALPARFQDMLSAYARFEEENKVLPIPQGYSQTLQMISNMLRDQYASSVLVGLLTILLLIPFVVYARTRRAVGGQSRDLQSRL